MLGGLARWLRAAGYDAQFEYGIADEELIASAKATGQTILSTDGPLFERNLIKNGTMAALFVPRQLSKLEQLRFVMRELNLPLLAAHCMACGGKLNEVARHTVTDEAPPLAFRNCERFWRCQRCSKLLWHGTHWQKITARLRQIAGESQGPQPGDDPNV